MQALHAVAVFACYASTQGASNVRAGRVCINHATVSGGICAAGALPGAARVLRVGALRGANGAALAAPAGSYTKQV